MQDWMSKDMDALVQDYAQRLAKIYVGRAEDELLAAARQALDLVAACLDTRHVFTFVQRVREIAPAWISPDAVQGEPSATGMRGRKSEPLGQALIALEETLLPSVGDVESAKLLWRMFSEARTTVFGEAVATLGSAQSMLQLMMDHLPQTVFWKDRNLVYLGCNRAFAQRRGLDWSDIVGKTDYDLSPAPQADSYRADDQAIMDSGVARLNYEEPQIMPDGEQRWLRTSKIPLYNEHGQVWAVLGMFEDVTEEKRAREALHTSQQMLQLVMDHIPQTVFWKDRNLVYLGCNQEFADDTGFSSPADIVGKTDFDMPWVAQADLYRADDQAVMDSGAPKLNYEEPQTTPTGEQIWLRTSKIPLRDERGQVWAILGMYEDVTEQKRAQEALRESEVRFRSIVEYSPTGIFMVDQTFHFVYVSAALGRIIGYTEDELMGADFRSFLDEESLQVTADRYMRRQRGEEVEPRYEINVIRKGGEKRRVELTATTLRDAAGQVRTLGQILDITQQVQAEAEQKRIYLRQAQQVQAIVQVSQELSSVKGLDELFRRVVALIKEQFGYYHAQIFQYEPALDAVVLVSGYGEVGERMLAEGHSLPMRRGIVGTAAATGKSVLAPDVSQRPGWVSNPNLPLTRGELAVPILLYEQVLGVIDIQSDSAGALNEEDRLLLESICGPIALAIESVRLRQNLEEGVRQLSAIQRAASAEGWAAFRRAGDLPPGFLFDRLAVYEAGEMWLPEIGEAVRSASQVFLGNRLSGSPAAGVSGNAAVSPLLVQEEPVGVLGVYNDPQHPLEDSELELIDMVSQQVAQALEAARLNTLTQDALAEARTLYRFGELLSGQTDVQAVYTAVAQALVEELGYASAFIAVANLEEQTLERVVRTGLTEQEAPQTVHLYETQDAAVLAFRQRQTLVFNDLEQDERMIDSSSEIKRLGRLAVVPIVSKGEVSGVIGISRPPEETEIGDRDLRLLEGVALQTANAVERARLFEQTEQALTAADAATHRYLRDAWDTFLEGRAVENQGYMVGPEGVVGEEDLWLPEMSSALQAGRAVSMRVEPEEGGEARSALVVPLKARGQVIGVVDFYQETRHIWTDQEQELIQALVEQVGESIESERQFAQTQITLMETERMYQASQRISGASSESQILQVVLDVATSTAADQAVVFLFEGTWDAASLPESQYMVSFWDRDGLEAPVSLGTRYSASEYPIVRCLKQDETLVVTDIAADERLDPQVRETLRKLGYRSLAALRLVVGADWLGYVLLLVRSAHAFTPGEVRVLEAVSDQAATALRSARLYQEAQSRARREELIREITSKMRGTPDLDTILNTAVQELGKALGVSRAFVRLSTGPAQTGGAEDDGSGEGAR